MYKLIDKQGRIINQGDKVECFRGKEHTLITYEVPQHSASSGKVWVRTTDGYTFSYLPSVFDLKVVRGGMNETEN